MTLTTAGPLSGGHVTVAIGVKLADPVIGLIITLVILRITWQSWRTISTTDPGEMLDEQEAH